MVEDAAGFAADEMLEATPFELLIFPMMLYLQLTATRDLGLSRSPIDPALKRNATVV